MSILVTGATGYIGSHVCKILHDNGIKFDALDRDTNKNNIFDLCDNFFEMDVLEELPKHDYDVVIHLAGLISVEESTQKPWMYYNNNLNGTKKVLDAYPNAHILFAGTAASFANECPYALSKTAAEEIIRESAKNYTIFRFFNVAGSDGTNGQFGASTHLIRIASECAAGSRSEMSIFGDDYDTYDGTCVRDYIHVVDLANAIVNSINNPANTAYECLGLEKGTSVKDVIETMKKVTDIDFKVNQSGRRDGDAASLIVEGKSKYLEPKHTLEDMCLSAYIFEKDRKN